MTFATLPARFALGAALAAFLAGTPGVANAGFFDQLFGGPAQPEQPAFTGEPQQPTPDLDQPAPRHRKKVVIRDVPPVRQMPTDIWHDKTLRVGDAYMMKDGLHVYSGADGSRHSAKQFVPVTVSRQVSKKERAALIAMDSTRNDPLKKGLAPDTIASGRSAAVSAPITKGFQITDARGASIRYVGP